MRGGRWGFRAPGPLLAALSPEQVYSLVRRGVVSRADLVRMAAKDQHGIFVTAVGGQAATVTVTPAAAPFANASFLGLLSLTEVDAPLVNSPAANAILADTGPLPAGQYEIDAYVGMVGTASDSQLQHRNAANGANIARIVDVGATAVSPYYRVRCLLALNERVRWQVIVNVATNFQLGLTASRVG
jgi:hypothetical protein